MKIIPLINANSSEITLEPFSRKKLWMILILAFVILVLLILAMYMAAGDEGITLSVIFPDFKSAIVVITVVLTIPVVIIFLILYQPDTVKINSDGIEYYRYVENNRLNLIKSYHWSDIASVEKITDTAIRINLTADFEVDYETIEINSYIQSSDDEKLVNTTDQVLEFILKFHR